MNKLIAPSISSLILLVVFYILRPGAFEQAIHNFPKITLENTLIYLLVANLIVFIFAQAKSSNLKKHRDNSSLVYGGLIGSATLSVIILSFYFLNIGALFEALNFVPNTYIILVLLTYLIIFGSTLFVHQIRGARPAEVSFQLKNQNESGEKKVLISELKLLLLSKNLDIYELEVAGGVFILAAKDSPEIKSAIKKINEIMTASDIRMPINLSNKLNQFLN